MLLFQFYSIRFEKKSKKSEKNFVDLKKLTNFASQLKQGDMPM